MLVLLLLLLLCVSSVILDGASSLIVTAAAPAQFLIHALPRAERANLSLWSERALKHSCSCPLTGAEVTASDRFLCSSSCREDTTVLNKLSLLRFALLPVATRRGRSGIRL